jgi:curved DNA-binding protein
MVGEQSLPPEEARRILGVGAGVIGEPLRRAYLTAVKASHPDRPGGDAGRLRAVIAAYTLLKALPPTLAGGLTAPALFADPLVISPFVAVTGGSVTTPLSSGRRVSIALPAGLRHGDKVRVDGRVWVVSVRAEAGASVLGDHLCLTVEVDRGVLGHGGRVAVATPAGEQVVWISRAAAIRGFVRLPGLGLPARGAHSRGHLFVRLRESSADPVERASRDLLRRFAAAWAA